MERDGHSVHPLERFYQIPDTDSVSGSKIENFRAAVMFRVLKRGQMSFRQIHDMNVIADQVPSGVG